MIRPYAFLTFAAACFSAATAFSQCPVITCPGDIITGNDPGSCNAVVTYSAPVVNDPCMSSTVIFNYTGTIDNWVVPAGITSITIEARGAEGGYNTSSTTTPGLGALMTGTFTVIPGATLKILVGEQPSVNAGNGGGGGTFVTDASNSPLIIAGGGGGSSQGMDSMDKHGQAGTTGGTGAGGGGTGGTSGNGGNIGASGFQSGAGGGLLTNGADGWTTLTGGSAFVNGGTGGPSNAPARGGFGGGGSGSSYVVGGGGGGYSGGGSGGNSTAGVGGGGASFNGGTSQVNTGGVNTGNGSVTITYGSGSAGTVTTMISGLASGSVFPVGSTTVAYAVSDGLGNGDTCSFTVTVNDTAAPTFTVPLNIVSCDAQVTGIAPSDVIDNCTAAPSVNYLLTGATTGSGTDNASGTIFNTGITTVAYTVTDSSGNSTTSTFTVTINAIPVVSADSNATVYCTNEPTVQLIGTPAGGTWSGAGVTGTQFSPSVATPGTHVLVYTFTSADSCTASDSIAMTVNACLGIVNEGNFAGLNAYPNPVQSAATIDLGTYQEEVILELSSISGQLISSVKYSNTRIAELPMQHLASGIYILTAKNAEGSASLRLVKK